MGAKITPTSLYRQAGIDPKTGMPIKYSLTNDLKKSSLALFRIMDEQDAVNRYQWLNIPCNLTSQEIERMLYYKHQLCFFYFKELDEFYFMPYALSGTIDFYGRYNTITPVPMSSGSTENDKKRNKVQAGELSKKKLKVVKAVILPDVDEDGNEIESDELDMELVTNSAVILRDYTNQLSQDGIPRQQLQEGLLDVMSDIIPYMRTALKNGTGVLGVKVQDADQKTSVDEAAKATNQAALDGTPWVAMQALLEQQELTPGQLAKIEDYLMALQGLDNLRLSTYGLENGGLFEKKAHMLESEAGMTSNNVGLIYNDGLKLRQDFCNIVNSIWDLDIWCVESENQCEEDLNGDGIIGDNEEGNGGVEDVDNNNENA